MVIVFLRSMLAGLLLSPALVCHQEMEATYHVAIHTVLELEMFYTLKVCASAPF